MAINPLTPDHLAAMQAVIQQTPEALEYFQKCKECGMDADNHVAACNAQHEFCQTVIRNFFPDSNNS